MRRRPTDRSRLSLRPNPGLMNRGESRVPYPAAATYCRVSTKEQVQNLSLSTQVTACKAYCEREGIDIA